MDWETGINIYALLGFPGGPGSKAATCTAGHLGPIPGSGRSPGGGNGYPLQYSCLENPMDRGTWRATVYSATTEVTQRTHVHVKRRTFKDLMC